MFLLSLIFLSFVKVVYILFPGREDELKVVLLERRDGLPSLVSTARRLAVAVKHKQTLLKDITPTNVDTFMQGKL